MYANIHSSIIHKIQNLETNRSLTDGWIKNPVYLYYEVLFSNKNDWIVNMHNHMDQSQNSMWSEKKSNIKDIFHSIAKEKDHGKERKGLVHLD